jgi:hypothetical protein
MLEELPPYVLAFLKIIEVDSLIELQKLVPEFVEKTQKQDEVIEYARQFVIASN